MVISKREFQKELNKRECQAELRGYNLGYSAGKQDMLLTPKYEPPFFSQIKILKSEKEMVVKRLQHLLQSEFIRKYDEHDHSTGEYKLDIKNADKETINAPKVYYLCDKKKCKFCIESLCKGKGRTTDITHAKNLAEYDGDYFEKEPVKARRVRK